MAHDAPHLPINFPCWVRAIYSWGGETKSDLGFLEGDLIECLNAGDGSWWTGRLRRDPRIVGSFPSNFVTVLDESFEPPLRAPSPLPPRQSSPNPQSQQPASTPQKTFRKPFQAYHHAPAPNPEAAAREIQARSGNAGAGTASSALSSPTGSQKLHRKPFSSMARSSNLSPAFRTSGASDLQSPSSRNGPPSPRPDQITRLQKLENGRPNYHRPNNSADQSYQRNQNTASRQGHHRFNSSPSFNRESSSPPPPAPPPHRYAPSRQINRTPEPPSDGAQDVQKHTPSPFTAAYADIMDTFKDMTVSNHDGGSRQSHNRDVPEEDDKPRSIYCPDDFEKMYSNNSYRPHTAMAAAHADSGYGTGYEDEEEPGSHHTRSKSSTHLSNYTSTMEQRMKDLQTSGWTPRKSDDEDPSLRPPIPAKDEGYESKNNMRHRPPSVFGFRKNSIRVKHQKSAFDLTREALSRTLTTKTNSTNATNSTNQTDRSLMSTSSIGQYSVKSAGSFYRKKLGMARNDSNNRVPVARPMTAVDYTVDNVSFSNITSANAVGDYPTTSPTLIQPDTGPGLLGGLTLPASPRRSGFFKRMVESARAGAATARVALSNSRPGSPTKLASTTSFSQSSVVAKARPQTATAAVRERDGPGSVDWVQVRRDLYRSNSISNNERQERSERCQMLDIPAIPSIDEFQHCVQGIESLDGLPVSEPTQFANINLSLVDKSARFVSNLPPFTTPSSLVQGYLCRPYRSDVQRLRAIFVWVSERISWEEDFEGDINLGRVMQTSKGCSAEIAHLVAEMCSAVGIHSEVVQGVLKIPGEPLDLDLISRPNHYWNAVLVDGEWRILDCSLASPTNPRKALFSTIKLPSAESFWFLTSPLEACYTHVPLVMEQQHVVPPMDSAILLSLPSACPSYFQLGMQFSGFDTSLLHLDNLETAQIQLFVPEDIELVAEMETRAFARDIDGDLFENGDVVRKLGLAQAEWIGGRKRYTIKAVLPGDEGQGVLNIYAGKRGLMHSIKSNPHPLAVALPISHSGANPPYEFLVRHPTPHAQRHDLYVAQPQCGRLAANNTFVFCIRQHPASLTRSPAIGSGSSGTSFGNVSFSNGRAASPNPMVMAMRPTSAMSMASISASGSSNYSGSGAGSNNSSNGATSSAAAAAAAAMKPAKLAIQTPGGKIIRLTRRTDMRGLTQDVEYSDGSEWETVIKVGERGTWRGLVLADRSARWCVFAEWECF